MFVLLNTKNDGILTFGQFWDMFRYAKIFDNYSDQTE